MRFRQARLRGRFSCLLLVAGGWGLLAFAQSLQAYLVAAHGGDAQAWWPTFGYVAAIHSIWAVLTWPALAAARAIERRLRRRWARLAAYLAIWPALAGCHVLLFSLVYWPVYRSDHATTRWAMAEIMFVRNFGSNTLLALALITLAIARLRWPRKAAASEGRPEPAALIIRTRGRVLRIPFERIDWISAAGDYAEIHSDGEIHLIEESLASLSRRLPAATFARIHRGTLIRMDRVRDIQPIGRGDAHVRLATGDVLRLSRRFRHNLASLLVPVQPAE